MKLNKAESRDKKRKKEVYGHTVDNRSIFTIQEVIVKKGKISNNFAN